MKQITNQKVLLQLCFNAFTMLSEGKSCRNITYKQMADRSRQIGSLLKRMGVEKGGKVLLISENSPEWVTAYFSIAFAGAVPVPLHAELSFEQIQNSIADSNICAVCLSRSMSEKIATLKELSNLPFFYIDTMKENRHSNVEILISLNGDVQKALMPSPSPIIAKTVADTAKQALEELRSFMVIHPLSYAH